MEDAIALQSALVMSGMPKSVRPVSVHALAQFGDAKGLETLLPSLDVKDLNAPDRGTGPSPLMIACKRGHVAAVETLLRHRAEVNLVIPKHDPALCCAVAVPHLPVVRLLLTAKADVLYRSSEGLTAVEVAALSANLELLQLLVSPSLPPQVLGGALVFAAQVGKVDSCQLLLNAHASVWPVRDTSALHEAAKKGHSQVIPELLQRGANINLLLASGVTPLMCAARGAHEDAVRSLIRGRAQLNLCDEEGNTALHHVVFSARNKLDRACARVLLHAKANPDIENKAGETASLRAVYPATVPNLKLLLVLLSLGANPAIQNKRGFTIEKVLGAEQGATASKAFLVAKLFVFLKLPAELVTLVAEYWA